MAIRDLIPWRESRAFPMARWNEQPFASMQREMDALVNEMLGNVPARPNDALARGFPRVNFSENPEGYRVSAELPGMDEREVQVSFDGNLLLVSGKKVDEKEEKGREWYRRERLSGEFQRAIELPAAIDTDKATATFAKGVLTVDVPKKAEAKAGRRPIEVKPG
jgi:HSP20 family protein